MNFDTFALAPRDKELHRRNAILLLALGFCSFACCLIFYGRRIRTGERDYRFLIWNLILAWAPLVFATAAHWVYSARNIPARRTWLWVLLVLWVLFFPNAPYLISDLKHLATPRAESPLWFDAILLGSFVLTGVTTGFASMLLVHDLIRRRLGSLGAWLVLTTAALASGVAIYLGRFVRLNSWDFFTRPLASAMTIAHEITDTAKLPRTLATSTLYAAFILMGYVAIFALARVAAATTTSVERGG